MRLRNYSINNSSHNFLGHRDISGLYLVETLFSASKIMFLWFLRINGFRYFGFTLSEFITFPLCCWTQVPVPDAHWGQANWNVRVWSRERFIEGPSKENRWLTLRRPKLPDGFLGKIFIDKIWGEGYRVHDVLLMRSQWGSRNLVLSLKLPSFTWVGALVPVEELKDIVMYIPWWGTRTLPHGCTIVSFCIPSLPWWVTAWICLLELRECLGGWSLFLGNRKRGTRKNFVPRRAPQDPVQFHLHSLKSICWHFIPIT